MTPDKFTIKEHYLDVGDGHKLYVHDWGNKSAKTPALYLHGGPGAGTGDNTKLLFDPKVQRVIFFDQRGAGKSKPFGSLKNNTTEHLVEDTEKIVNKLNISEFVIAGGSWGSCLALVYALKHPSRIKAMVLRGIFTGAQDEIDYLDKGQWRAHFPELWEQYLERTPEKYRHDPSSYHIAQIQGSTKQSKLSAYAYSEMEGALLKLDDRHSAEEIEEFNPDYIKIETHYLSNTCFLPDRYVLDNAKKLKMPIWIVQGRYDMICPPINAYRLNKELPKGNLIWSVAGHSGSERNIFEVTRALLLEITNR